MGKILEAPKVSTNPNPTLVEARIEYCELTNSLKAAPEFGWASYIKSGIENRLMFLRRVITDFYIKEWLNG